MEIDKIAQADAMRMLPEDPSTGPLRPTARIGVEDRKQVPDVAAVPFRWICQILVEHPNIARGQFLAGTAFLIDRYHLLSAAHNFYRGGRFASLAHVFIGCHGDRQACTFGRYRADTFLVHPRYRHPQHSLDRQHYDLAVARLQSPLPSDLRAGDYPFGKMPIRQVDPRQVHGYEVTVSGYPKSYPEPDRGRYDSPPLGTQAFQYFCRSPVYVDGDVFRYALDTTGGQSGSPLLAVHRGPDGRRQSVTIGIHVEGDRRQGNIGIPLDAARLDFVRRSLQPGPLL